MKYVLIVLMTLALAVPALAGENPNARAFIDDVQHFDHALSPEALAEAADEFPLPQLSGDSPLEGDQGGTARRPGRTPG